MNQQEHVHIIWTISFVVSALVFILAFMYSPMIGTLITLGYIMLYVGLSSVFLLVFREIEKLRKDTISQLKDKKAELEDVETAIRGKYYKKKIDSGAFKEIMQEYEQKLTEIEVKIKRLEGKKK